jgi:hypothetical protein
VVLRLPSNGFHVFGCIVATRGPSEALALADGGQFITLCGQEHIHDAVQAAMHVYAPQRRRPLSYRAGKPVGFQGASAGSCGGLTLAGKGCTRC